MGEELQSWGARNRSRSCLVIGTTSLFLLSAP
jgi:hypothetical protein